MYRFGTRSSRFALLLILLVTSASTLGAQSTYGSILGTVKDASGAVVPGALVTATNKGTGAQRTATSDGSGEFTLSNIDVGNYSLTITSAGFERYSLPELSITARESRRIDAALKLGQADQTVTVEETAQNVITTEVSNVAETKVGEELVSLPVAIYSRSTGSTSPIDTLTTEAGVQTDDSGNLDIMGATPALLSVTIDGISSVGVEYSGPINEMFPSFNSIEEIRVSESNNNAEFSGVADITTVSKAGTSKYHGGVFENLQNTAMNAGNPFQATKTKIIMNDFGGTFGGPVSIPHLYNGHDRSFFFASFEALRLPRETPIVASVPTLAMRGANGYADLTSYLTQQCANDSLCPTTGQNSVNVNAAPAAPCPSVTAGVLPICMTDGVTPIDYTHVPVSQISANMLQYLMPLPNYGSPDSYSNNYRANFPAPISANQGDIRVDQTISPKQTVFARFSYKNRQVTAAPNTTCGLSFCQSAGSPLQGAYSIPEIDEGLTFAYNYIFTPKLLNEFRGGYNAQHTSTTQNYSTAQLLQQTGLTVPQVNTEWSEAPNLYINGFMATGGGNPTRQRSETIELLDNVTWNKGHHNFKFGADFKRLTDHDDNVFGNYSSGEYAFDSSSAVGTAIGDPYTAFLAGFPDYTYDATINKQTMDGLGYSYAFYGQDDWKITPKLTLNLGLRYELHPPLKEIHYNTAFFLPDFNGTGTDGVTPVHGAVVVPNTQALSFESQDFVNAISPTPTLTAQQAGLPEGLRYTDKNDYGPRIGFAWRPYNNDKTVIRGGWGRFIESPLGFSLVSGWAVDASYVGYYGQQYQTDNAGNATTTPLLSLGNAFVQGGSLAGTASFQYAFPIHYKDPSVQQWNLTVEQDLGSGIGARFSYVGSHGTNLETFVDLNQVPASMTPYASQTLAYPDWSIIQSVENLAESNYNSGTVEVTRHSGKGIIFDASYTFTRDISNAAGANPTAFAGAGGSYVTDRFHPGIDYGNVSYDRKNRFLVTYLYDLPFGRGQRFLPGGGALNSIVGDWHLGGVTVLQSGPFLTPYQATSDPANTNILSTVGLTRADIVPGQTLYAANRNVNQWLNLNAFAIPQAGRGYFGTAGVGSVVGPGTAVFSMSLRKDVPVYEHMKFSLSLEAANVFNHRNYEPPNMQVDAAQFGSISALQTAEGAGPRSLELAGRVNF
jgi:hypothetical protein